MRTSGKRPAKRFDKKDNTPFNRSKKSSSRFGKKEDKPFEKRENKSYNRTGSTSKPYGKGVDKSVDESEGFKKSYGKKEGRTFEQRDNKPYNRTGSTSKSYGHRSEKSDGESDGSKRSYGKKEGRTFEQRDNKPFNRSASSSKPYGNRSEKSDGESDGSKKSYGKKEGRSFEKKENIPYNRAPSTSKPYGKRTEKSNGPSKAFDSKEGKPHAYKGPKAKKSSKTEGVRLNKYLANAGICSRREADELIISGLVEINGILVTELGTRVKPEDNVKYDGGVLATQRKVYILLNKPKDYVTTVEDSHAKRTVMELVANACKERVYPVGRLDRNTTGVLLLTNDGDLTTKLTHPKFEKKKVYHVFLDKKVTQGDITQLLEGFELEDGYVKADIASYIEGQDKNEVGIEIHSGKNRIVRRMFAHLGYKVTKLDRVMFAGLTKKLIPRGKWRFLSQKEVDFLKML